MGKDKFGFVLGSARSKAAAAYENGMTVADSAKFSGDGKPLRNLLADAAKRGHKVFQLRRRPTDRAMTHFLVERGKAPPAAVLEASKVKIGTPTGGDSSGLKFAPWEAPVVGQVGDDGDSTDNESLPVVFDEDEDSEPTQLTFSLESDLQTSLRANLDKLETGLKEIDDGREQNRRDITARDKNGNVVVIELKAGKAMPEAIAQIAAYMGEAKSEFGESSVRVRGLLIAAEFHERVYSAALVIPDLGLIKYRYNFTFEKVC